MVAVGASLHRLPGGEFRAGHRCGGGRRSPEPSLNAPVCPAVPGRRPGAQGISISHFVYSRRWDWVVLPFPDYIYLILLEVISKPSGNDLRFTRLTSRMSRGGLSPQVGPMTIVSLLMAVVLLISIWSLFLVCINFFFGVASNTGTPTQNLSDNLVSDTVSADPIIPWTPPYFRLLPSTGVILRCKACRAGENIVAPSSPRSSRG